MTITVSALRSPNLFYKQPIQLSSNSLLFNRVHANSKGSFGSSQPRTTILRLGEAHKFHGLLIKNHGFFATRNHEFLCKAENDGGGTEKGVDEGEMELRGESSMPERFRYLTKEAPEKPVRWPFLIVLAFLLYTWRTVLWELSNWKRPVTAIFWSVGYILKLSLAMVFQFLGDPLVASIRFVETTLFSIQAVYSLVINRAPIQELAKMIVLASLILAIAEAVVPDSVNSQPRLLTVAGVIGFVAARGYISELFFWTLLLGLFGFGRWIKKRDYVSSTLPVAAVLAAVGEPWIQAVVMVSYLSLAIVQHSRGLADQKEAEAGTAMLRVPFPMLCAALAIGIRLAAKSVGYRHLTWMIV